MQILQLYLSPVETWNLVFFRPWKILENNIEMFMQTL